MQISECRLQTSVQQSIKSICNLNSTICNSRVILIGRRAVMTSRRTVGASLLGAVALLGVAALQGPVAKVAAQQPESADAVLTGTVSSAEERRMEGVLVSAKR